MVISELRTVWFAVSAGILLSTVLNVVNPSPLLVLCIFKQTTATPISTFTAPVRLEDTARELPREPSKWDSRSATARERNLVLMPIPGGILRPAS